MIFKCKICGGSLDVEEKSKIITCDYCGTKQTLPKLESDKIANLYDRANHYMRNNEYDKAEAIYEMILNEDSKDSEAYWSTLLCKFGVEYVKDPKTKEYIPTCNRTQSTSILADDNYKQAIKYAEDEQKALYEAEAKRINQIQKGILEISKKEEPFDVFICYKETDEEGNRTNDSVIAQELYYQLQKEGLKVFFAKITLENKIGESYEPYIYAALNSAKVMLVIGSKKEYFEAPWVKNEWNRYLALIKNGENKTLIPCFKDMDAYDLPEEFSYLQSQDMSKIGFEQDLIHGIKKLISNKPQRKWKNKVTILGVIVAVIIIGIVGVINLSPKTNKPQTSTSKEIIRQDIVSTSGYTFTTTVEELKNELLKAVKEMGYEERVSAKELLDFETTYLGIGWFYEDNETGQEQTTGIEIYSCGEYVTSVVCVPVKYGSGDPTGIVVPSNLYEKAKEILGSNTKEWNSLTEKGNIREIIYDYEGEGFTNLEFGVGMRKALELTPGVANNNEKEFLKYIGKYDNTTKQKNTKFPEGIKVGHVLEIKGINDEKVKISMEYNGSNGELAIFSGNAKKSGEVYKFSIEDNYDNIVNGSIELKEDKIVVNISSVDKYGSTNFSIIEGIEEFKLSDKEK